MKKLVKFFESSRDKWKKKAQDAHYENKLKRNRITFLEESKEKLKQENRALRQRVSELESAVALGENNLDKKKCSGLVQVQIKE